MALSLDLTVHPQVPVVALGQLKAKVISATFDASYPTGGESLTPSDCGMAEFLMVIPQVDANAAEGHVVQYDYTAEKLMVFVEEAVAAGGPLLEIANASDLSTLVVRCLILGF